MNTASDHHQQQSEDVSWDDICVNPHESSLQQGRIEGHQAGLQAGYDDGFALGRTKGVEFGLELGFLKGALDSIEECVLKNEESEDDARIERIRRSVEELRRGIDEFPSPEEVFRKSRADDQQKDGDDTGQDNEDGTEYRQTDVQPSDILNKMQRLRAKFKVLTAQLKMPRFSLKQVMADAAVDTAVETGGEKRDGVKPPEDTEW